MMMMMMMMMMMIMIMLGSLFRLYDLDGDGKIERHEMITI